MSNLQELNKSAKEKTRNQYSLLDNDTGRFITSLTNFTDRDKLINEAFDYATEGNGCLEVKDWIQAGGNKEGALNLMDYEIIQTTKVNNQNL